MKESPIFPAGPAQDGGMRICVDLEVGVEGPSLVILKEELKAFLGKKVLSATGNTKEPKELLKNRTLAKIGTWGKVLFLTFKSSRKSDPAIITKTHFLMFGSYRIDEPKEGRSPRLELRFKNGTVYFYSCSFKFGAGDIYRALDRKVDLLSPSWDEAHVVELMREKKDAYLCDLFLDQNLYAGSGNIVKNEVLFNIRRHPLTRLASINEKQWPQLARAVRQYCRNFYVWKKKLELRRHWQVYKQNKCKICERKLKKEKVGKNPRRTFFCETHQPLRKRKSKLEVFPVLPIHDRSGSERRLDH